MREENSIENPEQSADVFSGATSRRSGTYDEDGRGLEPPTSSIDDIEKGKVDGEPHAKPPEDPNLVSRSP